MWEGVMIRKRGLLLGVALFALPLLPACGASDDTPTPADPTATPTPTETPPAGQTVSWADANCSGPPPNPVDALLTLRNDAGLPTDTGECPALGTTVDVLFASPHVWGDIDCKDGVTPVDALKILRFDAGLDVTQEAGCPEMGQEVQITVQ